MFVSVSKTKRDVMQSSPAQLCYLSQKIATLPPQSTCIHILHDNTLTQDNREKFICIAERYNQLVKFYNVEEICADKIAEIHKAFPTGYRRFTIGAFYRILIPIVLPTEIEKAIYLDGDIIVNMDINELWEIDLEDKPLGVVRYPRSKQFNSGVLFMNLKILRCEEETISSGLEFFGKNPQFAKWPDQNFLNYCFAEQSMTLPEKFNFLLNCPARHEPIGKNIYHYVGLGASLSMDTSEDVNQLWFSYFIRTPWFSADSIGNLYKTFVTQYNSVKNLVATTSAIVSGKARAFFVEPNQINEMKKYFSICDDETIIPAENEDSIQNLIDAMKLSQGKTVFFILTDKFLKKDFPFDKLTEENGFVENKDFVKAWKYLSEDYKRQLNSISFIGFM